MQKSIPFVLVLLFAVLILSCDNEGDLARLDIFNNTSDDIVELYLDGEESTGNLIKDKIESEEVKTNVAEVLPGSYTWRAENDDGEELSGEIDMFPGRNNLHIK